MSSILVMIRITVRFQESKVWNPHSLHYRRSYQHILMKFYGQLGCGLETIWLHYDPHHYPDPGVRSGWRLSVRRITDKVMNGFWRNFLEEYRAWPKERWVLFWWRSGSPSGSKSPKSEIRIHRIIEMLAFGRGLRCLSISSLENVRCLQVTKGSDLSMDCANTDERGAEKGLWWYSLSLNGWHRFTAYYTSQKWFIQTSNLTQIKHDMTSRYIKKLHVV